MRKHHRSGAFAIGVRTAFQVLLWGTLLCMPRSAFPQLCPANGPRAASTSNPNYTGADECSAGTGVRAPSGHGRSLTIIFGDSIDHLRHNSINVAVLSAGLIAYLWSLPEDYPRFYTRDPSWRQLVEAYTKPPLWSDGDWWFWNWVGHPFVGMQEYLLERNWGVAPWRAFVFSTVASVAWEYGFEASMERPSLQDMLLTSPAGLVLGEGAYQLTRQLRRNGLSVPEKIVVALLNPLHVLQHGFR